MKKREKRMISLFALMMMLMPNSIQAMTKDETVYTTFHTNQNLYKTTVVNHLYDASEDTIEDMTELKEILNINGKEKFQIQGKNITWNNKGKEIFYQGQIEKELPIEINIKYYLDGIEMTSKEMVGKKGTVKIIIELVNKEEHEVFVNGHQETLYTPFVVTAGTMLSGKTNSNIEVSNGRVINTGSRNMMISLAAPGLYDSLGMDEFKEMDSIIISYDTKEFKEHTIYLVATPKLIDREDFDVFEKLNSIYRDVDSLETNMNTIESGMNRLEEGASKLASGSKEISDNLANVVGYMKQLENGEIELEDGLKQVITALDTAQNQLQNSNTEGNIASLIGLKGGNNQAIDTLTGTNIEIKNLFANSGIDIDIVSLEQLPESLKTYKQTYDGNTKMIRLLTLNNNAIDQTITTTTKTSQMIEGLVSNLKDALRKLEIGTNTLYSSTNQIRSGVEQLYQGSITLRDGANTLYSGTTNLKTGISTYHREGIQKLSSYANQLETITNRIDALTNLSNEYKGFGSDNVDSTTFVTAIK